METPTELPASAVAPLSETIHGYSIEHAKTAFVNAILGKDEPGALYWGYELYYSELKFEIFYLLNEIYNLFYVEKHSFYFNGYLQTLAKEWEASKRKKHTILGSIIKNLVGLDISITDMVSKKTPSSNIHIIKHDNSLPDDFNSASYAGDPASFTQMTDDELVSLKREFKRAEKNGNKKRVPPLRVTLPLYVCEILDITTYEEIEYMPFGDWCNLYSKTSITQKAVLIRRRRLGSGDN